jgi:hypothetical protein
MKFELFQINLTDADYRLYDMGEDFPKLKAWRDAISLGSCKAGLDGDFYEKVAVIDAEDLDDVFEIGNIGPEENITRLAPMHSVSVGDLIATPDGDLFVVKGVGFEKIA